MWSSKSGLGGGLDVLNEFGKPELLSADERIALSGKEGSRDIRCERVTGNDEGIADKLSESSGATTRLPSADTLGERMEDLHRSPTGNKVAGCRRVFTEARDGRVLERECGRRRTSGAAPKEEWTCQQTYRFIKMMRK